MIFLLSPSRQLPAQAWRGILHRTCQKHWQGTPTRLLPCTERKCFFLPYSNENGSLPIFSLQPASSFIGLSSQTLWALTTTTFRGYEENQLGSLSVFSCSRWRSLIKPSLGSLNCPWESPLLIEKPYQMDVLRCLGTWICHTNINSLLPLSLLRSPSLWPKPLLTTSRPSPSCLRSSATTSNTHSTATHARTPHTCKSLVTLPRSFLLFLLCVRIRWKFPWSW